MEARYRSTLWACCFANFFQAVGSCFAILYVPLRGLYGLSFTDFGILVSLNFITQVASDVLFSKPVEKYGFRPFAVAAPLVSAAGLGLFAAAPLLFPQRPFAGFCAGMFLFAAAGGLQELLLSPILDALPIPEERKACSMSMLHSFFAWGQIFVVLATTGLLAVWGAARWQWIVLLWAAPPVAGAVLFCRVPLARKNGGAPPLPLRALARKGGLTGRETEILAMLARGRSAPFIAQELVISPNTVKTHVKHIYAKLGAHSQQEIIDLVDGQCAAE